MEEKKNNAAASGGQKKGTGNWKKIVIICLALVLAAAAYGWYTYNLPAKRLERALKKADALMEEHNYEEASAAYEKSQDINGVSPQALQGQILAELYRTDEMAAKASDIPSRAQVCDQYAQIMQLCDDAMAAVQDTSDERFTQPRTDAEQKRTSLQKGIAAEYEKVDCVVETEDRSGSVRLPDGSDIPYTQYFDLAKVQDEYYPYSEIIDAALKQDMDEYFADPANDISAAVKTVGAAAKDAVYRDYVGVEGFYSGRGLLCVRMAHVQVSGNSQKNDYCGMTFRLSDGAQVSLPEIAEMTDIGLRRTVRRRIWSFVEQQGYTDILKADVEDYVEKTDPADFKYCIRDDGTLCLIVDQTAPFFEGRQEILEIPLELED